MRIQERSEQAPSCPLCKEGLDEGLELHLCSGCNTSYHAVCSAELGGCATLGCKDQGAKVVLSAGAGEFQLPPERLEELRARVALEREARARRMEEEGRGPLGTKRAEFELIAFFLGCGLVLGGLGYVAFRDHQPFFAAVVSGLSLFVLVLAGKVIERVIKGH